MKEKCWCKSDKFYEECHKKYDEIIEDLKKKGCIAPPHGLIKNEQQIAGIREACRINTLVLDKVAEQIHEGMSTEDINKIVVEETKKLGGIPACLGYPHMMPHRA